MPRLKYSVLCLTKRLSFLIRKDSEVDENEINDLIEGVTILTYNYKPNVYTLFYSIRHLKKNKKRLLKENLSSIEYAKGIDNAKTINELSEAINTLTTK